MKLRFLIALIILTAFSCKKQNSIPVYTITNDIINEVDSRIFGAFFEKATWSGEIGSDAAISLNTGEVLPEVKKFMNWMEITLLRFPGGTAIDYYPWYNLIDSMPGKHNIRPKNLHWKDLSNKDAVTSDGRMGLHEYIDLCNELNIEPHLVTNLGDAFYKKSPIDVAAKELGADLVNYCNAKNGKMAKLRAANGSPEPFNVKYFQIGNETWLFDGFKKNERNPENIEHYTNCVEAYVRAMKAADPDIEIIIDGVEGLNKNVMERCGELISFTTFHSYFPWGIDEIKRNNQIVSPDSVSEAEIWEALACAPAIDKVSGVSIIENLPINNVSTPLVMTEWNVNCWFQGDFKPARPENEFLAYGIGSGSYLNAILRVSGKVKIANQSMLVGTGWGITGIRVDTTEAVKPHMYPTGMVTGLYSKNHGNLLLKFYTENEYRFNQPISLNGRGGYNSVAEQDIVVTSNQNCYFLHVVSRSYNNKRKIKIQFPQKIKTQFTQFKLSEKNKGKMSPFAGIEEIKHKAKNRNVVIEIDSKSVSVFKFDKL